MKRNVYILTAVGFIVNLGFSASMPLLPFLLLYYDGKLTVLPEELGTISTAGDIAVQITVLMAAFMITRAFLARYFGNLSDILGRKKIIILGLVGYTILAYSFILARNWIHILIIRAVQGIASAMVWPVAEAMITDSVPWQVRGRYMGLYIAASNVSFFVGPIVGAYTYKFAAYNLKLGLFNSLIFPFYILTALAILALAISFFTIETIREGTSYEKRFGFLPILNENNKNIVLKPEITKAIKVLYIMGFANGIAMGLIAPISMLYVIQYITSDPMATGLLSTIAGIVGFIANFPAGYLSDKIGRKKIVIIGQVGTRTATFVLPFSKTFEEIATVYALRTASFNITSPAYRALQADLVPKKIRGKVFGTVQSLFNFGAAVAPFGGYIYQVTANWWLNILGYLVPGVAVAFWLSAIIGVFSTILFILFIPEPKEKERE